jgi:hypothetical protein
MPTAGALYRVRTESASAPVAVQVVHMSLNSPAARAWRLKHRGWPRDKPAREWLRVYTDLFMTPRDAVEVARCVPVEATEPTAKLAVRLLMKAKFIREDGAKAQRYLTKAMRQLRRRFPPALPELTLAPNGRLRGLPSSVEADYYQSGPDFAASLSHCITGITATRDTLPHSRCSSQMSRGDGTGL